MKIGLVLDHFDPRRGGVEQWTCQLACGLLRARHEVHVVAAGFGHLDAAAGIIPHRIPTTRSHLACAQAAEDVLKTLDLDVIHDMGLGWHCHVFQPHGGSRQAAFEQNLLLLPRPLRPVKRAVSRWLPRYKEFEQLSQRQYAADGRLVLALSEMVERDLKRFHAVPQEQLRLIYNGVNVERFSPAHRAVYRDELRQRLAVDDRVVFLIVAHNFRLKGVPALLRAFARSAELRRKACLVVVGGKRIAAYRNLARRLGVERLVRFAGPVDNTVPYYAAVDVYVQPTFYDPCSLVVLEALASELPVITSRFNGAGEFMTPGVHGDVLDNPADVDRLAASMTKLLDPFQRRHMGQAARALAEQNGFDQNVERILQVYYEIAGQPLRAAA